MRLVLVLLAVLFAGTAAAQPALTGAGGSYSVSAATYTGPGDIVAFTAWYGLRAYNSAYRGSKAINVRRASDNTTQDINVLSSTGALDVASANTFAGTDATCTGTIASTTLTCASASSTPHAGSTLTGASITQPSYIVSCGTFTGGAGTCTLNTAQTVSVAETITMQYGLYIATAYDQTGGGQDATQATQAAQPQLLPNCVNSLPCMSFLHASNQTLVATTASVIMQSYSAVYESLATNASDSYISAYNGTGNQTAFQHGASANQANIFAGSNLAATASDNNWHAASAIIGASSTGVVNVDGTETTGTAGTGTASTKLGLGSNANGGTSTFTGYLREAGALTSLFSSGNRSSLHTNMSAYWGTP